jgi:hypothetical protein
VLAAQAARRLEEAIAPALGVFHPRVLVTEGTSAGAAALMCWVDASLVSVCALELLNHVAEGAVYKRCQNETCGRLFVRQEGRAKHGQYRKRGVTFCSERCNSQQKQREYRRRNRTTEPQAGARQARREEE